MRLVAEDFFKMCITGYGIGLPTVAEAFMEVERHYDLFFSIKEAHQRLKSLEEYINERELWGETIRRVMGDAWCDKQDAEEAAFWEKQKNATS